MSELVSMFDLIRDSIALQVRDWLARFKPTNLFRENLYALLVDVPAQGDVANAIAATEESLDRFIAEARAKQSGKQDPVEQWRAELRWHVPGEDEFWYWCDTPSNAGTNHLIRLAVDRGIIKPCEGQVCELAFAALEKLEAAGEFGVGPQRETLFVGVTDVETDFNVWFDDAARCNPPAVMDRVKQEWARAVELWGWNQ